MCVCVCVCVGGGGGGGGGADSRFQGVYMRLVASRVQPLNGNVHSLNDSSLSHLTDSCCLQFVVDS